MNQSRLQEILVQYKKGFVTKQWPQERYKWEAVKHFQDHWDPDAADFPAMLEEALGRTAKLLNSGNYFPKMMITRLAKAAPQEVRVIFAQLFDESVDLLDRFARFKSEVTRVLSIYGTGSRLHYQDERAISTYLWLRYPDKYYSYKLSIARAVSQKLEAGYPFVQGRYAENIQNHITLYDELCSTLREDAEIASLMRQSLDRDCYSDPELKTLTIDFGIFISRSRPRGLLGNDDWWPSPVQYDPGLAVADWERLLGDPEMFSSKPLQIMKRLKHLGGEATCLQLATEFGESWQFYNSGSSSLAERIAKKTKCRTLPRNNGSAQWWPVLYTGRTAAQDELGSFVYRLRDELSEALDNVDLSSVPLYANEDLVPDGQDTDSGDSPVMSYTKDDFLGEVFMTSEMYDRLTGVLRNKKNIILQGAPGVGKTFAARRLAWSMMGEKDEDRVQFVQFHQNYSYEDFVMGYKPSGEGFELKNGIFYEFCQKAANYPDQDFFFLIDEINRGNLSKIFGELLMLIERDYRGASATLAYNGLSFAVPENVHIIGMMNTADRSLAMIDYALRRRFSFFEIEPGFETEGFTNYREGLGNGNLDALIVSVQQLNLEIRRDKSLGKGFCIGHSYFCGCKSSAEATDEWLSNIVEYDILPMLAEYWFDEEDKVDTWRTKLAEAIAQ